MKSEVMKTVHGDYQMSTVISYLETEMIGKEIIKRVIESAAEKLAEQFLNEHGQEILKHLDPQAVANLAIADSGRVVRESLEKSIKTEVQHHYHNQREVYKVGLFGSVKRIT